MSMTDPIADFSTRIRNAITARKAKVIDSRLEAQAARRRDPPATRASSTAVSHEDDDKQGLITIELRYDHNNRNAIEGIRRVSRPGQRRYVRHDKLPKVRSGLGIAILTTSKGVMTDRAARKAGLGGELLCEVW